MPKATFIESAIQYTSQFLAYILNLINSQEISSREQM